MTAENYISDEILQELTEQKIRLANAIELEHESLASLLARQEITTRKIQLELASLDTQVATQTALNQIELASRARARELIGRGAIANADMDAVEKNYLDQEQQLNIVKAALHAKRFELEESKANRESYSIDSRQKVAELETRVSEIDRQIASTAAEQTNIIRAPVGGTITTLTSTLGQKLDAGVPVVTIIPENSQLEAHLYVPTSAIGFVREGQQINLRYEAFPYQRFGLFAGSITQVTNSVLSQNEVPPLLPVKEPVYRIMAALARQTVDAYGQEIVLKPGMLLTADIELDKRSLFEWLLAPLYSLRGRL